MMILLNLSSGQYYELNDVGHCIWALCDGTKPIEEMIAIVCEQYEAPAEAIRADIMELLQELVNERLLLLTSG